MNEGSLVEKKTSFFTLSKNLLGPSAKNPRFKDNLISKLNFIESALSGGSVEDSCQFVTSDGIPFIAYKTKNKIVLFGTVYYNYLASISHEMEIIEVMNENTFGYAIDFSSVIKEIRFRRTIKKQFIYDFATSQNLGHYIWNECTAMHFLIETNLIYQFHKIRVGKYDYFNIADQLKNRGLKVTQRKPRTELLKRNVVLKTAALTFSKQCRDFVLTSYELSTSRKSIGIQIRTGNRGWTNSPKEFAEFIENLHIRYPEIDFVIDGFSRNSSMQINENLEIERDLQLHRAIETYLSSEIKLTTTIGRSFRDKIEMLSGCVLVVGPIGSGNIITNWLLNKPLICFGPQSYYSWTQKDSNDLVYNPRSSVTYFPIEHLTYDENGNYKTDMQVLFDFVKHAYTKEQSVMKKV